MLTGIRAVDIMSTKLVAAAPNMTLIEASKLMNKYRIGGLPVLRNYKLVGMITERDIMRKAIARNKQPKKVLVKNIMQKGKLITADKFEDIDSIARKIAKHDKTRIPIVHKNKLVGIVTNRDILKHSHEHLSILIEQARIKGPSDKGPAYPLAHGKCDNCGASGNLAFKGDKFLCEFCL